MAQREQDAHVASSQIDDPIIFMQNALQALVRQSGGMRIRVAGEEVVRVGGDVLNVRVNSAWIGFEHDGCVFRTDNREDRDKFWDWVVNGTSASSGANFKKVCGTLPPRPVPQEEPQRNTGFVPRSRRHYGRDVA